MSVPCEKKVDIDKILDRVTTLEISKGNVEFLIEQFMESNKEVATTMRSIQVAMTDIHNSMTDIRNASRNNEKEIKNVNKKIDKMYENEEKHKIDPREILKKIVLKSGIGFLGLYGIYELIIKSIGK